MGDVLFAILTMDIASSNVRRGRYCYPGDSGVGRGVYGTPVFRACVTYMLV